MGSRVKMTQTALVKRSTEHVLIDESPMVMTAIYEPNINLVVWQRELNTALKTYLDELTHGLNALQLRTVIGPSEVEEWLSGLLPAHPQRHMFIADVVQLAEMYADLFGLNSIGLRLSLINETMCPRFHTDHFACRMVTTYHGHGSEWLNEAHVDRSKLGTGAGGLADHLSGIYQRPTDIQQLCHGDVALLKGDGWLGNQVGGIVHRSPHINKTDKRLLLTLDFAE